MPTIFSVFLAISGVKAFRNLLSYSPFLLFSVLKFHFSLSPLNLSSSLLFFLQYLSKLVACSYHCLILVRGFFVSISFFIITLLISLLNSSTNGFFSYSLPLAVLLNSCTNYFIIPPPCSNFFNSTTFTASLSSSPNFFFKSARNSSAVLYSKFPDSRFSNIFFFHMSADSPYT